MIKSLNKAYQTDSMYYWCNAEGEVNYPGSGFSTGDSERLPAAVKELYEHYQFSPGCDANLYTVTYSGEDGMLLTTMFNSNWMDVPAVKDTKQKARKALRSIATELTRQCKPWGTVLFGEDTDPEGDEIALFVPAEECASHFEEAVKLFDASAFFERVRDKVAECRYLVFLNSSYVRDAQGYFPQQLSEDADPMDESQEGNWADCGGPMLVMDVYAASKAEVAQKIAEAYPNVDMAVFKILRCDGEMTEVTALV